MNPTFEPDEEWLSEQGPRLVLMARQWVACHADAEDVVQTAFVRFWRRRDVARDPLAYLYRTVRTTAMNYNRSQSRRQKHEASTQQQAERPEVMFLSPAEQVEQRDLHERATQALTALPIEQREVIVMRTWGQLTFEAIGQVLDIPPRTAQSRYRNGLEAMRERFETTEGAVR